MIIISEDQKRIIDIGEEDIWKAVYSTIISCIGYNKNKYPLVFDFIKNGKCYGENGYETARQFNLIRDELSRFPPEKAVYDIDNPSIEAPWKENLSPVITSCANLFTTEDGKDLLYELVSILTYAQIAKKTIIINREM